MKDVKIAVCIPTYNRSLVVEEFLVKCSTDYVNLGIDIYIYDSSTNSETENVVNLWMKRLNNLYYIRVPSYLHANMKVFKIFQQHGLRILYDFIWVCGDTLRFNKEALTSILSNIIPQYDMIEINGIDMENLGTRLYTNHNDYFRDCAWHLTLFGAVVLNVRTMLSNVNWKDYELRYSSSEFINFSHVSFYFNKLASMNNFKALHISLEPYLLTTSVLRENYGWYKETLHVICCGWVQTIKNLPSCYEDKKEAIVKFGKYTVLNTMDLIRLREDGHYNISIYKQYRSVWNEVCDIPIIKLYMIALMPASMSTFIRRKRIYLKTFKSRKLLKKFLKRYNKLIIYGAGKKALRYGENFIKDDIPYIGHCVTELGNNDSKLLGHSVFELADIEGSLSDVGIVLAINPANAEQVIQILQSKGLKENIFYNNNLYSL
jgi:hypothetical protein